MRILVLQGSPNANGSTALLAAEFGTPGMTRRSGYPEQARALGKSL